MTKAKWPYLLIGIGLGVVLALWWFGTARDLDSTSSMKSPGEPPPGMVWIPGGEFQMGSDAADAKEDEKPVHRVRVSGFFMDETEVTNAQFAAFVAATNYVTLAERKPNWEEMKKSLPPGTPKPPEEKLQAGAMVFTKTREKVQLQGHGTWIQWWRWQPGACWRVPQGDRPSPQTPLPDAEPVVQVCWEDAVAFSKWAGKRLPTEAEWEFAARGGLISNKYVWGNEPYDRSKPQANIWQGEFPVEDLGLDKYKGIAPVKSFPPNSFGLYDMSGNVWEFCSDWYRPDTYQQRVDRRVIETDPPGPTESLNDCPGEESVPQKVIRGGSFLCNDAYCTGYRPSARMKTSPDTAQNHLGFRCVMSVDQWKVWKSRAR